MRTKSKSLKAFSFVLLFTTTLLVFHNPLLDSAYAATYTSDKLTASGSSYTLSLDLSTTSWTRGTLVYFDVGLTVNSFGSGITNFHAIELWMKFANSSGYEILDSSTGGIINTVGGSFEDSWYLTPSLSMADNFTLYIGSKFVEEAGVTDPSTDDLWTPMANISVSNPPPPTITHPEDITFNEGDPNLRIAWSASHVDQYAPDYFEIFKDGEFIATGIWTSPTPIYHPISHLLIGDYSYTIFVYDDYDQVVNDTVLVHVRDFAAPVISSPADMTIEVAATSQYVMWTAAELHPASYEVLRDGISIASDTWDEYTLLRFSLDSLILGTYNYCLILTDESNNIATDCVIIEVVETTRSGSVSIIISILSLITLLSVSSILKSRRD